MTSPSDTVRELAVSKRAFSRPATTLDDAVRLCDPFTRLDPREDVDAHHDLHLPIIEVRQRQSAGGGDYAAGIASMATLLRKRVRFDLLFEEGNAAAEANTNRFPDGCNEEVKRELLRHLFVLEYQSGDAEPWWAVHPLVERCRKYGEHP
jgi:hypothetical protein